MTTLSKQLDLPENDPRPVSILSTHNVPERPTIEVDESLVVIGRKRQVSLYSTLPHPDWIEVSNRNLSPREFAKCEELYRFLVNEHYINDVNAIGALVGNYVDEAIPVEKWTIDKFVEDLMKSDEMYHQFFPGYCDGGYDEER